MADDLLKNKGMLAHLAKSAVADRLEKWYKTYSREEVIAFAVYLREQKDFDPRFEMAASYVERGLNVVHESSARSPEMQIIRKNIDVLSPVLMSALRRS